MTDYSFEIQYEQVKIFPITKRLYMHMITTALQPTASLMMDGWILDCQPMGGVSDSLRVQYFTGEE